MSQVSSLKPIYQAAFLKNVSSIASEALFVMIHIQKLEVSNDTQILRLCLKSQQLSPINFWLTLFHVNNSKHPSAKVQHQWRVMVEGVTAGFKNTNILSNLPTNLM